MKKKGLHRHTFRFKIPSTVTGKEQTLVARAKVKIPSQPVQLMLKADHVRRSIKLKGVGNTATCSMAVCTIDQKDRFPHPVAGFIDWQYSRAYVVSKVRDGLPVECYVYGHNDEIAKLNDTKGGQKKLLKELEQKGDRIIYLTPRRGYRGVQPNKPTGNKDGSRSPREHNLRGAKLRFAVAQLGGVAA